MANSKILPVILIGTGLAAAAMAFLSNKPASAPPYYPGSIPTGGSGSKINDVANSGVKVIDSLSNLLDLFKKQPQPTPAVLPPNYKPGSGVINYE